MMMMMMMMMNQESFLGDVAHDVESGFHISSLMSMMCLFIQHTTFTASATSRETNADSSLLTEISKLAYAKVQGHLR